MSALPNGANQVKY